MFSKVNTSKIKVNKTKTKKCIVKAKHDIYTCLVFIVD